MIIKTRLQKQQFHDIDTKRYNINTIWLLKVNTVLHTLEMCDRRKTIYYINRKRDTGFVKQINCQMFMNLNDDKKDEFIIPSGLNFNCRDRLRLLYEIYI